MALEAHCYCDLGAMEARARSKGSSKLGRPAVPSPVFEPPVRSANSSSYICVCGGWGGWGVQGLGFGVWGKGDWMVGPLAGQLLEQLSRGVT